MSSKIVRDAVHGDIELDATDVAIIDTPEMQRLRGVKQLGTASLVYPSALHARFEHALGTLHMARRIMDRVTARGAALSSRERTAVSVAALVHDVTHIPFGHTFEDERRLFDRHDAPGRTLRFLRSGDLARAIDASGVREDVEAILAGEHQGSSGDAASDASGRGASSERVRTVAPHPRPLLADIVRGTVGADLLDYLARDAYFCGFRRSWDERVLRYFEEAHGRLALRVAERGIVRQDAVSEALQLLWLRYSLCERVYYHHAKVAAGAMVSKAVELALEAGLSLEDLFSLRDEGLLHLLAERYAPRIPALGALLSRIEGRRLLKRAYVLTPAIGPAALEELVRRFHWDRRARAAAEQELCAASGAAPGEVIVYCPAPSMAAKEADIPVVSGEGEAPVPASSLGLPEVDVLIRKHRALWRFYVFLAPEASGGEQALARAAERLFGFPSERRAEPEP